MSTDMIERIIDFSLKNRMVVMILTCILIGLGFRAMLALPIDAVPDVTNVQVQVLTNAPALGPLEVEQFITTPVETLMSGLPRLEGIRSVSKFGLSAITVVFEEGTDVYFARQLVQERLGEARESIPEGYGSPEMGPISTGLGEIYQFEVKGDGSQSPMELRAILDWFISPRLRQVPGVIEVNSFGGELKTYEVRVDPRRLEAHRIPMPSIFEALERNSANVGGAYIVRHQEQVLIRGEGLIQGLGDVEGIVLATDEDGVPVFVKDVASVAFAPMVRQGAVTRDGRGEAVVGIAMLLMGENSRTVVERVKEKLEELKAGLPAGVTVDAFYDRADLIHKTIRTVGWNLLEGGALVIVVLLLFLGNLRAGLIVASAIPLSMLFAVIGMHAYGISGNLMSLGSIDFGLIVDGSVVMIENILRLLEEPGRRRGSVRETVREAALQVGRPVAFAVGIILIVYLPILSLRGVEGKMFTPMACTVIFALAGSLLLSLTLMPVLATFLLRFPRQGARHLEPVLFRGLRALYRPALRACLRYPVPAFLGSVALLILCVLPARRMGAEFMPRLDEGSIAVQAARLPSVSLEESIRQTTLLEKTLLQFPEVLTVVSKTGRPEIATDPMGVEVSDVFVMLRPPEQWPKPRTREELVEAMSERLALQAPGGMFSFSQPIELRVAELIAGVRADVAIRLYGEDLAVLQREADAIVRRVSRVRGAEDVKAEQTSGLPFLRIRVDREAIARYGINASEVLGTIEAIGGKVVGTVLEGARRFPLQVRFEAGARDELDKLRGLRVAAPNGAFVPLAELTEFFEEEGPAQISHENVGRGIAVEVNVRGRDIASFVAEAKALLARELRLPPGYTLEWGGQFKNLQAASERLLLVVPLALFLIFALLFSTFRELRPAVMIYLNVPFAASGGILALHLRGMPFSISAAVGFIALAGVAVLNGVVLASTMLEKRRLGLSSVEAALAGGLERLRPVLTTALVAVLGFVPMALSRGAGAEVQKPLATVVIGGLLPATLLTLLVLPALYGRFGGGPKQGDGP